MKIRCKWCLIILEAHNIDFHDIEKYSTLKCGGHPTGANHEFIGVIE